LKLRQETLKNMHHLIELGDCANTTEIAERFGCNIQDMLHRLQRYARHGYLVRGEHKEIRVDKRGYSVTRKIFHWSPTDKLRDLVAENPIARSASRQTRVANSVWQWGQL
jgi:hypothetical protein